MADFPGAAAFTRTRRMSTVATSRAKRAKTVPRTYMRSMPRPGRGKWNQNNLVRVKLCSQGTINSTAGGLLSDYTTFQAANGTTNWSAYANMYDQYRVRALSVRYDPILNVSDLGVVSGNVIAPVITFYDNDQTGATIVASSQAAVMGYDNKRIHPGDKAFTVYCRCPVPAQSVLGKPAGWLDCQVAAPTLGALAAVTFQTNNVASLPMYVVTRTLYVEFKNHI